jgi:heme/copper-type cytochrome/quinol oxidase subunit 3
MTVIILVLTLAFGVGFVVGEVSGYRRATEYYRKYLPTGERHE